MVASCCNWNGWLFSGYDVFKGDFETNDASDSKGAKMT